MIVQQLLAVKIKIILVYKIKNKSLIRLCLNKFKNLKNKFSFLMIQLLELIKLNCINRVIFKLEEILTKIVYRYLFGHWIK
jgi:hypothetical protein